MRFRPGERLGGFIGAHTAIIRRDGKRDSLVVGSYPLRTESGGEERLVDLTLQQDGEAIRPSNGLVPTAFPMSLKDGVALGSGITARLVGGDAGAGRPVNNRVFYADAFPDADVVMSALQTGMQFFVQVRGPAAPTRYELKFELPDGTELRDREGPVPGVEVVRGDERLASLSAPMAMDADGLRVETSHVVRGDTVELRIEHAVAETKYPAVLDPVYEDQPNWNNWNIDMVGW